MQRLPELISRAVFLARQTGQRRVDLIALTWANYDGTAIRLRQVKGRRRNDEMVIPLLPEARAELDRWKRKATSTLILTNSLGLPWKPCWVSTVLMQQGRAIGLRRGLNLHGLRKLAAATLAEAGCSVHQIMSITGHRTLDMVQLYTRSVEQKRLAYAAVVQLADHRKIEESE